MSGVVARYFFRFVLFTVTASAFATEPPFEPMLRIDAGMHTNRIERISVDTAGRYLVTASADKTAKVWELSSGRLLITLHPPQDDDKEGLLNAVAISPEGGTIAVAGWTGHWGNTMAVYLFDRVTGRLIRSLNGFPDVIREMAWSVDGQYLAIGLGGHHGIRAFRTDTWKIVGTDNSYGQDCLGMDFSKEGRLATSSLDGYIRIYSVSMNGVELIAKQVAPGGWKPDAVRYSPDGSKLAVGFGDSSKVNVLDAITLNLLYAPDTSGVAAKDESDLIKLHSGEFRHVAWSSDGLSLLAAGAYGKDDFFIRRWADAGRGHAVDSPATHSPITDLLTLPNNEIAFSSSDPAWGVLGVNKTLWDASRRSQFTPSPIVDFNLEKNKLQVSQNGATVGFKYDNEHTAQFSLEQGLRNGENSFTSTPLFDAITNPLEYRKPSNRVREPIGILVQFWQNKVSPYCSGEFLLSPPEISRSLALSPDGTGFVLGASLSVSMFNNRYDPDNFEASQKLKVLRWSAKSHGEAWAVNISGDSRFVVAAFEDGTIRWYEAKDGKEVLAFFPHADQKRWVAWTPEGYYTASPGGEELIGWHLNQGKDKEARFIPNSQLYDVFYRPDIVQAKFRGEDISGLITLTAKEALKNPPPEVAFTRAPSSSSATKEKVCYKITSTGGGIGEVRLFQNGKLVKSDGFYREAVAKREDKIMLASNDSETTTRAIRALKLIKGESQVQILKSKGNLVEECQEIDVIPGENELGVVAFNAQNTVQSSMGASKFMSNRASEAPHLYILGIGIDQYTDDSVNLKYATKDALDFQGLMKEKSGTLFASENIHLVPLSNAQASKENILKQIDALAAKVKPWDSFILFVASHGVMLGSQYYLVSSSYDGSSDLKHLISSNEIVELSKKIRALNQLYVLDTCHAGGVDNIVSGLYDARMSVLAKKMGLHIYASAGGLQEALDGYQGNGLFTHTLLASMKLANQTDGNHDGKVSVLELGQSAKDKTSAISKQIGHPQIPTMIHFGRDVPLFNAR